MTAQRYEHLKERERDVYELFEQNTAAIVGVFVGLIIVLSTTLSRSSIFSTMFGFFWFIVCFGGLSTPVTIFDTNTKMITLGHASLAKRLKRRCDVDLEVPFWDAVVSLKVDTSVENNGKSTAAVLIQEHRVYGGSLASEYKVRAVYEEVLRLLNQHGCSNVLQITALPNSMPGDQILVSFDNRRFIYVLPDNVRPGQPLKVSTVDMNEVEDDAVELVQVVVPEGKVPGDAILCMDNSGNQFTAPVPQGQRAGNTFIAQIATATAVHMAETVNSPTYEIPVAKSSSPRFGHNRVVPADGDEQVFANLASTGAHQRTDRTEQTGASREANSTDLLEAGLQEAGPDEERKEANEVVNPSLPLAASVVEQETKTEGRSGLEASTSSIEESDSPSQGPPHGEDKTADEPLDAGEELQALLASAIDKGATVETFCRDRTSLTLTLNQYESVLNSLDFDFQKTKVMETLLPKMTTVKCAHLTAAIRIIIKDDLSFKMLQIIDAHAPYIQDKSNIETTLAALSLDEYDMKVARRHFGLDEKS